MVIYILLILAIITIIFVIVVVKRIGLLGKTSVPQKTMDLRRPTVYGPRLMLYGEALKDVYINPNYLKIDCAELYNDSAVRHIYIKNTCIKDLYDMQAEDMNNHEKQNGNGCMILGRCVLDTEKEEYEVSLEEVVMPGDDAVFKENEFSFGGKIKLNVVKNQRKLRKETNTQYNLTCWVHSRPGSGVSFSNADSEMQMLLKHPIHPKFLTAIIIDTLTSELQLGIYTFKRDMTINSESDIKKMYSLKEMYKWALASIENESNH